MCCHNTTYKNQSVKKDSSLKGEMCCRNTQACLVEAFIKYVRFVRVCMEKNEQN